MPTYIAKINSRKYMPELEKHYTEWNNHFCAVYKGVFLLLNKYIFQLTKYEDKDIRESVESDDKNLSSIGFAEQSFLKHSQL